MHKDRFPQKHERRRRPSIPSPHEASPAILHQTEEQYRAALKRAEQDRLLFSALINQTNDAIFVIDPATSSILYVNNKACEDLQYDRDELLGMKVTDVSLRTPNQSVWQESIGTIARIGDALFESSFRRKDGTVLPVEVNTRITRHGERKYLVSVIRDITLRKQTETSLNRTTRALRTLSACNEVMIHAMHEPLLLQDICRVIVDKGAYRMAWVGYREEDEGKTVRPVAHGGYEEGYLQNVNATWADTDRGQGPTGSAIRTGRPSIIRNTVTDPRFAPWREDALKRNYRSVLGLPLAASGQVFGALTIYAEEPDAFDHEEMELLEHLARNLSYGITALRTHRQREQAEKQQRNLQAQLLQAQKMEAVGQLAGGIAHDFNNILTAIMGYGNIVLSKARDIDAVRSPAEQVLVAAKRAANLTRSLLAFSRKQIISPQPADINAVIEGVGKLLHRIIGEDIELVTVLDSGIATVLIDTGQMEQVLMNLGANARDAMPKGGKLVVGTAMAVIDDRYIATHGYGKRGSYVLVTVSDTGAGMDEVTSQRVFEPFFTTKEPDKGTGLGLSIVYGIVKQHNGFINVVSVPGRGTTFLIYLPVLTSAEKPAAAEDALPPPRGGNETVLLVEDDSQVRSLEKEILESSGYQVVEAVDGEDAIDKLREHGDRIDLLITDVIMPKKNGREVHEAAKQLVPGIDTLFVSGYPADIIRKQRIIQEGLNFLPKPASPQDLLQKVREVLDARQAVEKDDSA